MESSHHQFLKPFLPADDHRFEFELYTIPGSSGWFSWDNIHEIEKSSLKEFFDGTSFTRNPRVYKEYRDFIISKYREDPSRRLTFSEVRKALVGDVNYLLKVFLFLQKWGLINFSAPSPSSASGDEDSDLVKEEDEEGRWKVKVEEGPPHGVRVVAIPNSLKPVSLPALSSSNGSHLAESDFKMPPLSSHSDVYQELIESVCGNCKELCDSGHYEYTKDKSSIICVKCFKNGSFGNNKSSDDYTFLDSIPEKKSHVAAWTEAETLLLLESVLKHGDDWDLVAQNVETKSKQDCISKLIQLPFGQLMLGPTYDRFRHRDTSNISNNQKQEQENPPPPPPPQETKDVEPPESKIEQNGDADSEEPPPKRICIEPISDSSNSKMEKINNEDEQVAPQLLVSEEISEKEDKPCEAKNQKQQDKDLEVEDNCFLKTNCSKSVPNVTSSLMQQVSRISVVVGPMVAASAAEAAVTALCEENEIPKEMFDSEENGNELQINESERISQGNDSEMDIQPHESEKGLIPLALRMRATSATALGAAAAHAKLLAIQEDKQIERLVSTVIKTQLKKLQYKMELLKQVEGIMEKEFTQIAEVEELLVTERMDVVQKAIDGGVSRWRDRTVVKSQVEIIL